MLGGSQGRHEMRYNLKKIGHFDYLGASRDFNRSSPRVVTGRDRRSLKFNDLKL